MLAAAALASCGGHRTGFCGLVRTGDGFDPVAVVHGMSCADGRAAIFDIERDEGGGWTCSRAMHAAYELDCRQAKEEVQILERVPVHATRHGGVVRLANWSFRIVGGKLQARQSGRWLDLAGPPFCVPNAPRDVLVAFRLRPLTPHGGCFAAPRIGR